MKQWLRGCAAAALVAALAGQAFGEEVFVRAVPLHGVQPMEAEDTWNEADVPLPDGVRPGTLDAQMVRWRAAHPAPDASAGPLPSRAPAPPTERAVASLEHWNAPVERAVEPAHYAEAVAPAMAFPPLTEPTAPASLAAASMANAAHPRAPAAQASFTIAGRVLDAAAAFDDYTRSASGLNANFAEPAQVAQAVHTGSAYEPNQLASGAAAYAALVALNDPRFVAEVRAAAASDPQFAARVLFSPSEVLSIAGAAEAGAQAQAVLRERAVAVTQAGAAVKQAAYDVQRQPWSRGFVANPGGLLAQVKLDSSQTFHGDSTHHRRMLRAIAPARAAGATRLSAAVTRGLALAALAAIGEAGEANAERIEVMLADGSDAACLRMAKLNLFQCMAVAGPQYEDLFCTGQHAVADTGRCMMEQASTYPAVDAAPAVTVARAELQSEPDYPDGGYGEARYAAAPMH